MPRSELDTFLAIWNMEAQSTLALLRALPKDKYDFRPDPGARSVGELSWHLAEIDGYITKGVEVGNVDFRTKPDGLDRPKTIEGLAPAYERVHNDAVARVKALTPEALERPIPFVLGEKRTGDILWGPLLHHYIHHRGQLSVLCRLAGGVCPSLYGPNREETEAFRAKLAATSQS